ncbi:MAG: hypothetical protein CBC09_06295 [Cellvibrionales bacterium TMED49]|nr:hypothetical protein [Porticoccaceae bacterium]OUU37870.1 MAG: hypothetical protein CBC09_06295 [Cellvibrionales bacterium TMED49]|tara:strand:+ start:1902 stop:2126 length:225 start_codon:yes stop_codon:yes gene_type:complete
MIRIILSFAIPTLFFFPFLAQSDEERKDDQETVESEIKSSTEKEKRIGEDPNKDEFKPSEEISEDFPVPLPADI